MPNLSFIISAICRWVQQLLFSSSSRISASMPLVLDLDPEPLRNVKRLSVSPFFRDLSSPRTVRSHVPDNSTTRGTGTSAARSIMATTRFAGIFGMKSNRKSMTFWITDTGSGILCVLGCLYFSWHDLRENAAENYAIILTSIRQLAQPILVKFIVFEYKCPS